MGLFSSFGANTLPQTASWFVLTIDWQPLPLKGYDRWACCMVLEEASLYERDPLVVRTRSVADQHPSASPVTTIL